MRYGAILSLVLGAAVFTLAGCGAVKPSLTPDEQRVWEQFLSKHLSSTTVTPTPEDAGAVAAIGDKLVPYIEEQFGAAARVPRTYGKSEYWLVVVLGRIGTPRAVDAIVKVLESDWPGAVGRNREAAANALVWLGAQDRIPDLEAAIADHERRIQESGEPERYADELVTLNRRLEQLKTGEGKRDTTNFPFG